MGIVVPKKMRSEGGVVVNIPISVCVPHVRTVRLNKGNFRTCDTVYGGYATRNIVAIFRKNSFRFCKRRHTKSTPIRNPKWLPSETSPKTDFILADNSSCPRQADTHLAKISTTIYE